MPKPLPREYRLDMIDFFEQKKQERRQEVENMRQAELDLTYKEIAGLLPDNILDHGVKLVQSAPYFYLDVSNHKSVYVKRSRSTHARYLLLYGLSPFGMLYDNFYDALIAAEIKPRPKLSFLKKLAMSISGFEATND
jgi:hypothetical protein